jgi:hypothetical protein
VTGFPSGISSVWHVDERDEFFRRVVGGDDSDRRVARVLPDCFPNCSVEIVGRLGTCP